MNSALLKFLLLIVSLLFACNINVISENNVQIKRIPSNDSIRVSFWEPSVFGDNRIYTQKFIFQNECSELTLDLKSSKVLEVAPKSSILNSIYVTQGDSVMYCVKQDKNENYYIEFYGKNSAHYNYSTLRNKELKWTFFFKKDDNLEAYKQTTFTQYNEQMNFLLDYIKKYPVSSGFISWAEADIRNEYIFRLYLPLSLGYATIEDIPKNYFSGVKIIANDLSKYYSLATNSYIQFYTTNCFSNFNKIYSDFIHNESGKHRAYLLSSTIGIFAEKQNRNYFNELLQAIDQAPEYVNDSIYLDYINKSKIFYLSVDEQFPDSVLSSSYLISYDTKGKVSLKEALDTYKNKALYIDFWASWCGPCRRDISKSQDTKKYLAENQIEYLYISIDDNENNWKNASEEDKILRNQFRLLDSKNSPLTRYLEMKSIPRYLLLNKEHRVKDFAAPSSSVENFEALKESITTNFKQSQIHTIKYF